MQDLFLEYPGRITHKLSTNLLGRSLQKLTQLIFSPERSGGLANRHTADRRMLMSRTTAG